MVNFAAAPAFLMVAGSLLTCGVALSIGGQALMPEVLFGMAAPLVSAVASWQVIQRAHAVAPASVTKVLIVGFAVKALLFGAYVAIGLVVLALRPVPFIAAFTGYYVALHLGEALLLKRLIAFGERPLTDAAGSQSHN
jgi:hypothetical protein